MKLRRLAELAALVALHRDALVDSDGAASDAALRDYLQFSRQRHFDWRSRLQRLKDQPPGGEPLPEPLTPFVSEVLIGEMLTRIWTALLTAGDARRGLTHAAPIARHVLVDVLEVRCELLRYLLGSTAPLGTLLQADRVRRKVERWTDLLIGEMAERDDVLEFAVDPLRAADYRSQSLAGTIGAQPATWRLLTAGIQQMIPDYEVHPTGRSAAAGLDRTIRSALPVGPMPRRHSPATRPINAGVDSPPGVTTSAPRLTPPDAAARPESRSTRISLQELLRRLAERRTDPPKS